MAGDPPNQIGTPAFSYNVSREGPSIDIRLDLTIPIPGVQYGMVKPGISINSIKIDPSLSPEKQVEYVTQQVEWCLQAVTVAMPQLDQVMEMQIANLLAPQVGSTGYGDRLTEAEKSISSYREKMSALTKQIEDNTRQLAELISTRIDEPDATTR